MTDFRARGFDNPSQLREHLMELEEEVPAEDWKSASADLSIANELAVLRNELAKIRALLSARREQNEALDAPPAPRERHNKWTRIAAAVAMSGLIGSLVQHFRRGAQTMPITTAQVDCRLL